MTTPAYQRKVHRIDLENEKDAQARGWGRPCTARLVTVQAAGISLPADKRVADLVEEGLRRTHKLGYYLHPGWCWGYACRHILNDLSKPMSNHSWGLAVDLNAPTNGYGTNGDFPTRIDRLVWNEFGFRSGKDYHETKDPMHKEFMGTPDDAARLHRIVFGRKHVSPPRKFHPPAYPGHTIKIGEQGHEVYLIQTALKVHKPDGIFGPITRDAVKTWERGHGYKPADGIVGERAWNALFDHRRKAA